MNPKQENPHEINQNISRRNWIKRNTGLVAATAAASLVGGAKTSDALAAAGAAKGHPIALKGRIKQSIAFWCVNASSWKWDVEKTCQIAKKLGCPSVELVESKHWPILKKHGLTCAIALNELPPPPFVKGLNNLKYHEEVIGTTSRVMDTCAEYGFPSIIAFTGYKWRDAEDPTSGKIPLIEGAENCVIGLKKLAAHAEKKKVMVCLEMLNTRDDTHPMKGHPGYQGDNLDYCAEIIKRVGSPYVKLLFDIYHVQIMDGDVIRRIRQYGDLIGHVHTAGNPGRAELTEDQEISYPAVMRALLEVGYKGYVGQEFIPTRDPEEGLSQAVRVCDV